MISHGKAVTEFFPSVFRKSKRCELYSGQEEHHRIIYFQDDFEKLLKRYEIEFGRTLCVG